jgi:addiction module HigA family antidote
MGTKKVFAIHPGELLLEEFMKPLGLTTYRLAKELHVPAPRLHDIVKEKRAISADTALRLAVYFNMTPQFWMNAQADYDLRIAKAKAVELNKIKAREAA